MTPKVAGADLDDLMRADGVHSVSVQGKADELDLLECGFRYPATCARQRVWLPEISDWCLDYTDGDPTLWVITARAWYKIAGPISGVLPHWSYRSHFTKPRLLFEACFHIASVLREWLPKNPGLSYRATLQQVVEQSILGRYPLTTKFLIENFKFVASQMGSLGDEYGGNWLNSAFFKQLQRMHDSYIVRTAKAEKAKAESEAKRLQREKEVLDRRQKVEDERLKKDEVRKQKESERLEKKKYPMEDMEVLLELPETERDKRPPYPATPFPQVDIPGNLLGELLMAYQTLVSYKPFIRECPTLEFAQLLVGICSDASASALGEVFVAVLRTILESNGPQVPSAAGDVYGVQEQLHQDKLSIFTWPEVLRALIRPEDKYIGPVDPLVGCEAALRLLASQPNAAAFLEPVDVEGLGLTDYLDIVSTPMDLGTVKARLQSGAYERDPLSFHHDVKLIWTNAIRYNGEHTDIGKTAVALSDLFEAEYARLAVDQHDRLHRRNQAVVDDLAAVELHEALRVGEFSQLEFDILRDYRKVERDVEAVRRHADKNRREREDEFRQMCINQGIPTNYNNVFSDATKKKHEFIAEFYTNIANERVAEESAFALERKAKEQQLMERLKALSVRFEPLGSDRFHGRYWLFDPGWLFYEWEGSFSVYTNEGDVKALLQWLNVKGVRESLLHSRLESAYDTIVSGMDKFLEIARDEMVPSKPANVVGLPTDTLDAFNVSVTSSACDAYIHAVRTLVGYVSENGCAKQSFGRQSEWLESLESVDRVPTACYPFLLELEQYLFTNLNDDLVQDVWKRKRHDWRSAVEASRTFPQLLVLVMALLDKCFIVDAFIDYVVQLDRKEWLKLRPKPSRNFCPEVDQQVVYFGDGHDQAVKADRKNKKPVKCDAPLVGTTLICRVTHISYHHGSGDPYAMLTLRPESDAALARAPGSYLCTSPSAVQKLGRILARIVSKLRAEPDAGPFLDPVSKADFPTYTDIIVHPMDLSKISQNVHDGKYKTVDEFVGDVKLMADNCQLFCEGRFPTLPPMARHLVTLCQNLVKKHASELKAAAGDIAREQRKDVATTMVRTNNNDKLPTRLVFIIRLENRLPEYIIDSKRYESAIRRAWKSGDRVRILYRDPKGNPTEYYTGVAAGSLPFDQHGLLPWEALRITWDEDDGTDDNRVNPWYVEAEVSSKK
ncbi:hypothetical protein DYB32_001415 [Aphanomyces invadans]|uniref:Bromo domain-containing protein n=1 Tax=Aphanomyces invadans TaxID=157072 RepID=A0A418B6I9_9STRA|nr:hypothetical protein DYB32_001415 [Aphanomyces invadans]